MTRVWQPLDMTNGFGHLTFKVYHTAVLDAHTCIHFIMHTQLYEVQLLLLTAHKVKSLEPHFFLFK